MAELFTDAELAAHLKTATVDAATADAVRRIVTAVLRAEISFDPRPFDGQRSIVLPVDSDGLVRLPPLLADVIDVNTVNGNPVPFTSYRPGDRTLLVGAGYPYMGEVEVSYTYAQVPEELRAAALMLAADVYGPTSISGGGSTNGVRSETVGPFSVTYAADGASTAGVPVSGLIKSLLRGYRSNVASVRLRSAR